MILWGENRVKWKGRQPPGVEPRTPCLEPPLFLSFPGWGKRLWAVGTVVIFLRVHDPNHTHSLASFQWSGLSDQQALQLTESCLQIQKWCPYKARGVVPELVCANKARNGPVTASSHVASCLYYEYLIIVCISIVSISSRPCLHLH